MPIDLYKKHHLAVFESEEIQKGIDRSIEELKKVKRIFFLGNGGSNAVCSHMMEDYAKMGRFQTHTFSDAAMLTCYANDYGYDKAFEEWLKVYLEKGDLVIAVSSSGNSMNIINAVNYAKQTGAKIIGLSGFKSDNKLKKLADISFHIEAENYGVVECIHHTILHIILDKYVNQ